VPKVSEQTRQSRRGDLLEAGWRCLRQTTFTQLTVDQLCAEAGVSKGAFYGHFQSKQDFLLALLEQDASELDGVMERMERSETNALRRLRGFARTMLSRDRGRAQVRADLWAEMPIQAAVRALLASKVAKRRGRLRAWIEEGVRAGELADTPANALASLLLAVGDGLSLHAGLDPGAFRWENISRAVDLLLAGLARE
jgi:AcrR family transcriptional regulator